MSRRTAFVMMFFVTMSASAESLLRGTLITNKKKVQLVVNAKTRSMRSFALKGNPFNYNSGVKVEVCLKDGEIIKIRPLGPSEAVFIYENKIKDCSCKNYGKFIESPTLGEAVENPGCDEHPENK